MKHFFAILFLIAPILTFSQKHPSVQILQDSIKSSFRGLSVPSDDVIWVTGSNGTVGRSTDAGETWKWIPVPGFEKRDFRDIEAFDSLIAIIMAVDNPADILKTTDGGKSWKVVFHKEQEGMFLDAMDFKGRNGICIGDPLSYSDSSNASFFIITSLDSTLTQFINPYFYCFNTHIYLDEAFSSKDEAIFAGSGSNIKLLSFKPLNYAFITGGKESNLVLKEAGKAFVKNLIPIIQGKSSTGAFSMYAVDKNKYFITGGDYVQYWKDSGNVVYTEDAGKTWKRSSVHGYRSCIIQADKKTFLTCGTNGVDISFDGCKTWQLIHGDGAKGTDGFNVCAKSKTGKAVYFAGPGRIGKLK